MSDITREVRDFINDRINDGVSIRADWLTAEIIERKSLIAGDDLQFYRGCAFAHVREIVRSCIKKYQPKADPAEPQLTLPGFDHLQKSYFIRRDGEDMLIPVDQCTDMELLRRAREYEDMARGCRDHAREIHEYVAARREAAA